MSKAMEATTHNNEQFLDNYLQGIADGLSDDGIAKTLNMPMIFYKEKVTVLRQKMRRITTVYKYKNKNLTGQEIADIVGLSFTTIQAYGLLSNLKRVKLGYILPYNKNNLTYDETTWGKKYIKGK